MAEVALLFRPVTTQIGATGIGVIELDCTLSTTHSMKVEATKHPVERGAKITDHLRPEPDVVTLEGLISDTPVSRSQQTRAVQAAGVSLTTSAAAPAVFGVPGYAAAALAKLVAIKDGGILVTLATELRTYTDMALTSLDIPRDARTGDALRFSATFEKIIIVTNKVTQLRPARDPRANKQSKAGRQAAAVLKHVPKTLRKVAAPWVATSQAVGSSASETFKKFRFLVGS